MRTYVIEASRRSNPGYRIVASFQTDDDEKAVLVYCKFRRAAEAKENAAKQVFLLRKFVPTKDLYLEGVTVTNLEVLCWGTEDISDIGVPEVSPAPVAP